MARKAKVERRHLPALESPYEKWRRKNVGAGIGYGVISKAQLAELEEKLEATESEEEKPRLCKEFMKAIIRGN